MSSEFSSRMQALTGRLDSAELRLSKLISAKAEDSKPITITSVERVRKHLYSLGLYSVQFIKVPKNYYDYSLDERATLLNAKVPQLCKSIILENTACSHNSCNDPSDSRYYCVIIQYQGLYYISVILSILFC